MTKIRKKLLPQEVDGHITAAFDIIRAHLPERYVPLVQEKLKELEFPFASAGAIRNFKQRGAADCHNIPLLTAMLEVARVNMRAKDTLRELLLDIYSPQNA